MQLTQGVEEPHLHLRRVGLLLLQRGMGRLQLTQGVEEPHLHLRRVGLLLLQRGMGGVQLTEADEKVRLQLRRVGLLLLQPPPGRHPLGLEMLRSRQEQGELTRTPLGRRNLGHVLPQLILLLQPRGLVQNLAPSLCPRFPQRIGIVGNRLSGRYSRSQYLPAVRQRIALPETPKAP